MFSLVLWVALMALYPISLFAFSFHPSNSKELNIKVVGDVGEVFDSNVTYAHSNAKKDVSTELRAGVEATYERLRHRVEALLESKQQIYAAHHEFSNNAQDLDVKYFYERTKRDRITVHNVMKHYYDPRSFEEQFGRSNGRYSYLTDELDLDYTRDISEKWALTLTGGAGINTISREDLDDSHEERLGTNSEYKLSSKLSLLGGYEYARRAFFDGPSNSIQTAQGGFRYYFTERLYTEMASGAQFADSANSDVNIDPMYQVSLNGALDARTLAKISFEDLSRTTAYSSSVFESRRVSLSINRQLLRRLGGSVSTFFGWGEYKGGVSARKENLWGTSVSLVYDLTDRWKTVLGYSLSILDTSGGLSDGGYHKNTSSLRAIYNF